MPALLCNHPVAGVMPTHAHTTSHHPVQSGTWALSHLTAVGRIAGSAHAQDLAYQANKHAPSLVTHDRYGNRVDQVEFHPAYVRVDAT